MKIVLVNYRYFISGGPERYYFNIKEILENKGHEIIPFSIKSSHNYPSNYDKYFLDIVDDEVYFANTNKKYKKIFKFCGRMFYSFEAKHKFKKLLNHTKPDIIYIMQYHNKISPSIIDVARSLNIPVVHRISDFQYLCPNALLYNDVKGICEDCLDGKYLSCIKYKCVLNSYVYSAIKLGAKVFHDSLHVTNKIDAFVVPSSFTLAKLNQYGIPQHKLNHIPTFFNLKEQNPEVTYNPFALFVGRIEKQKGLMTLLKTFIGTSYNLKIIGFSNDGYDIELKEYLKDKQHNIEFLGKKDFHEIIPYLKSCLFTTVPSEWYDNFPNVILESFAFKKAVLATDFGSLPELVRNKETGLTFKYANAVDCRDKVSYMFEHPENTKYMGYNGYKDVITQYSPETHYNQLFKLFESLIK
ncbi:glycosyltransferase family 4 protein [Segatella paludivivens]|uniref:glycosyltransferase family 4 protein n=1 Tax=Segatella paludivivens TaxID=185294 RepID=UPI00035F6BCA|nr:glycosyltransferase family 4 protein [Segatella paludivivens]